MPGIQLFFILVVSKLSYGGFLGKERMQGGQQMMQESISSRKILKEIFDNIHRQQVFQASNMPWSAIGRLIISGCPDIKEQKLCTGALIGPKTVITAAHCMYTDKGWCSKFSFQAGYTDSSSRVMTVSASQVYIQDCFIEGSVECDVGLLTLQSSIGYSTGYFKISDDCFGQTNFNNIDTAGYPLDKGGEQMFHSKCEDVFVSTCSIQKTFMHKCDTYEGMSGAPMWTSSIFTKNYFIRGINLGAYNYIPFNMGASMSNELLQWITDKKQMQ